LTNCIGSGKTIKTKYVAQKNGAIDCGVAGTAMLINNFYPEISYSEIVYSVFFPIFSYFGSLSSPAGWVWDMDYEFFGKLYGLEYKSSLHEGNVTDEQYEKYLNEIKGYIDRGIPVMVGGWDLYYDDFYGSKLKELGMGPGQAGHNIVVAGYDRDYIYYLDPGAVVAKRDPAGNVTYKQSYENFKMAVTSKWKLVYFVYEKVSKPLPEEERLKLVEQRNRDKFYGKKDVYDLNLSINKASFPYSKFGFEAFEALKEDLIEENFSKISSQRKEYSKKNFLFSMLGVGSTRYVFYNNAWATEWGSKYLREIGRIEDADKMEEINENFTRGEELFQQIFKDYNENELLTENSKVALTELRKIIDNIENIYREIL